MQAWKNSNGFTVLTVPYHADPKKNNKEWLDKARLGLRDDQFRQEVLIDFSARGGQKVFPYLETFEKKFLVKPWGEIPKNYTIVAGLDYGSRNPSVVLWCAVNERGHFHVFSEFYKPSSPTEISRYLKNHPYFHRLTKLSGDPSIWNKNQNQFHENYTIIKSVAEMIHDLGVYQLEKANNDRIAGLERVKYMFRHSEKDVGLQPYLTISEDCLNLWKELTEIVYKEESPEQLANRNASEDTVKKKDHAFDALKYVLLSWKVPGELVDKPKLHEYALENIEEEMDRRADKETIEDLLI